MSAGAVSAAEIVRAVPAAACPRCGYDQAGAIAAWDRQSPARCPLHGLCSECGLEFAWGDLLNPEYARRGQLFEHARRHIPRSFLRTLWCTLHPWSLWQDVRMEQDIVWARLIEFVAAGLLVTAGAAALVVTRCNWLYQEANRAFLGPYNPFSLSYWNDDRAFSRLTAWPAEYWGYGSQWWFANPYGVRPSPQCAVALLAFLLSPAAFLLLPVTLRRARVRRRHPLRVSAYAVVSLPTALAAPVVLATLVGILNTADFAVEGNRFRLRGMGAWWEHHRWVPMLACVGLWMWLWWTAAAGRYFRLPHARAIGATMTALSLLIAVAIIAAIPGGATWLVWGL